MKLEIGNSQDGSMAALILLIPKYHQNAFVITVMCEGCEVMWKTLTEKKLLLNFELDSV